MLLRGGRWGREGRAFRVPRCAVLQTEAELHACSRLPGRELPGLARRSAALVSSGDTCYKSSTVCSSPRASPGIAAAHSPTSGTTAGKPLSTATFQNAAASRHSPTASPASAQRLAGGSGVKRKAEVRPCTLARPLGSRRSCDDKSLLLLVSHVPLRLRPRTPSPTRRWTSTSTAITASSARPCASRRRSPSPSRMRQMTGF